MKKTLLLTALSGVLLAVSGPAWAEPVQKDMPPPPHHMKDGHKGDHHKDKHDKLKRIDTDGDGIISESEFMDAHKKRFQEIDSDGDGSISKEEAKAHRKMRREKMKEHREKRKERRQKRKDASSGASE